MSAREVGGGRRGRQRVPVPGVRRVAAAQAAIRGRARHSAGKHHGPPRKFCRAVVSFPSQVLYGPPHARERRRRLARAFGGNDWKKRRHRLSGVGVFRRGENAPCARLRSKLPILSYRNLPHSQPLSCFASGRLTDCCWCIGSAGAVPKLQQKNPDNCAVAIAVPLQNLMPPRFDPSSAGPHRRFFPWPSPAPLWTWRSGRTQPAGQR